MVPTRPDLENRHRLQRARGFDKALYRKRNIIERLNSRLKDNRAIATRYAKEARYYMAMVLLACIRIWLDHLLSYRP